MFHFMYFRIDNFPISIVRTVFPNTDKEYLSFADKIFSRIENGLPVSKVSVTIFFRKKRTRRHFRFYVKCAWKINRNFLASSLVVAIRTTPSNG